MPKLTKPKALVAFSTLLTIAVNLLANALPINGMTTAELSDAIPVLFVPAGYVFAIWGVIYLGMIGFVTYYLFTKSSTKTLDKIAYPFVVSNLANAAWIVLWHYQYVDLSVLVMVILLGSLLISYYQLNQDKPKYRSKRHLAVYLPMSIYLGWISVATIANVSALLVLSNWDGFGIAATTWTIIMLMIATILGNVMLILREDLAYAAVLIWAFVGIYVKSGGVATHGRAALAMSIILAVLLMIIGYRQLPFIKRKTSRQE